VTTEQDEAPTTGTQVSPDSLFSRNDRREFVLSFCKAFLNGDVETLAFDPKLSINILTGNKIPPEEVLREKREFMHDVSKACGVDNPPQSEIDLSIDKIFVQIILWRGGGFLKGSFLKYMEQSSTFRSLSTRIEGLEQLMERLIEEVRMLSRIKGPNQP